MIAGWMDGYITGSNQHADDTYDVTSFESTEMLAAVVSENCKKNPDTPVFAILRTLIEQASEERLRTLSEKITVTMSDRSVLLYEEVLKRVQQRLIADGHYQGTVNGEFDSATREALKRFQQSNNLKATGFPDQVTLWRLLKSDS
jgi:murein L,D-transpeptidase YcbB/YkuD